MYRLLGFADHFPPSTGSDTKPNQACYVCESSAGCVSLPRPRCRRAATRLRSRWAMSAPKIVNDKRTLYVGACARAPRRPLVGGSHPTSPPGGLEESVTTEILHAAFLPFGEITDVNLVLDAATRARLPLNHVPRAPVLLTSSSLGVCREAPRFRVRPV